jgi:hypothetical protein
VAAVLVVAAAAGAVSRLRRGSGPPPRPAQRVILLGFDGVAPNILDILVARGQLPNMKRLIESGVYGRLRSASPAKSAILWTSIATGKGMLKHGIIDWTYVNKKGLSVPYEDRSRRVKTYWEILSERGLKTGTLNWWTSYPPAPIMNGYIVSNAFRHTAEPGTVHPMRLYARLEPLRLDRSQALSEMPGLGLPRWAPEDATVPLSNAREVLDSYALYVAQDLTVDRTSDYLWEHEPAEMFSTYFRLVDVTSHFAVYFADRKAYDRAARLEAEGALTPEEEAHMDEAFASAVAPAYRFMDRIVGKYLARLDEHTALVLCSDHGFRFFKGNYAHAHLAMEPPDGVILLAGSGLKSGTRISGASIFDVAPTLLHLLGQPAAADMDGTVLTAALQAETLRRTPVRTVASYETGARRAASDAGEHPKLDKDVLDDLKTLGYIGNDDEKEQRAPRP